MFIRRHRKPRDITPPHGSGSAQGFSLLQVHFLDSLRSDSGFLPAATANLVKRHCGDKVVTNITSESESTIKTHKSSKILTKSLKICKKKKKNPSILSNFSL